MLLPRGMCASKIHRIQQNSQSTICSYVEHYRSEVTIFLIGKLRNIFRYYRLRSNWFCWLSFREALCCPVRFWLELYLYVHLYVYFFVKKLIWNYRNIRYWEMLHFFLDLLIGIKYHHISNLAAIENASTWVAALRCITRIFPEVTFFYDHSLISRILEKIL